MYETVWEDLLYFAGVVVITFVFTFVIDFTGNMWRWWRDNRRD